MKILPLGALVGAHFFFAAIPSFGQGSLTPPTGPAPTMKTLDQVEARIVIDPKQPGFALPFTINQSGSYYLAGNVTATGSTAGIIVAADDVTIDLNGFALIGGNAGSARGIDVPAARKNLAIRNGTVRDWAGGGVRAENASGSVLEKLRASGNSGGILSAALAVGSGSLIRDCVASNNPNTTSGFKTFTNTTVTDCTASSNGGYGFSIGGNSTIVGCTANANSVYGIITGANCTVVHCNTSGNAGFGISSGDGCVLRGCAVGANSGAGLVTGNGANVTSCSATGNTGGGIQGGNACTVSDCTSATNTADGIYLQDGGSIHNCTARQNGLSGMVVGNTSYLFSNMCDANNTTADAVAAGMRSTGSSNRVDSNTATNNGARGFVFPGSNFVTRNTAWGQRPNNYSVGSGAVTSNGNAQGNSTVNGWVNWDL